MLAASADTNRIRQRCSPIIYETEGFESFICKIAATYAEGSALTPEGKIDYHTLKPVLFEMPTYEYLRTGEAIGKCMSFGTQEKQTEGDH